MTIDPAAPASASASALHIETPLVHSSILSKRTGHNVYLKLDSAQPSGSFKIRGIGRISALSLSRYGREGMHLVCSSGGNAGLATAHAARTLGVPCTIFVPTSTEGAIVDTLRRQYGAEVVVEGAVWNDADTEARRFVEAQEGRVYIHPFDGAELVRGHATLVREVYDQMPRGEDVDAIICAVGGGGLVGGILHALSSSSSSPSSSAAKTRVITTQCFETDSFTRSLLSRPAQHVTLDEIRSKATSMGTRTCSASHLDAARRYGHVTPVRVDDDLAASAVWQFYRDHGVLVELSCGAALAPVYFPQRILSTALAYGEQDEVVVRGAPPPRPARKNVVVVVCGGSKIDAEMVKRYEEQTGDMDGRGRADVDGVPV
ncbi:uncharacterized protein PFL1_03576 [Pseudozyma flocculosa PF-1]|uniref:L-serine ammonia-lyase n=2 Tax=Pseudozyma flocculosa TaxID=84751 RepID=A0A5C3F6S4_9BASI|nr:uncharacterized protein PFL1_03576 [Pseudozyma flocculosa PF-1]EPQ28773.1 hypothetical protein PFL1_03576 [Pseudozyma flocculosa PF-1]SPO39445.1 related to CHA1 - L-serine/L-threonine deaminase [Pseudozyma flocculosa]